MYNRICIYVNIIRGIDINIGEDVFGAEDSDDDASPLLLHRASEQSIAQEQYSDPISDNASLYNWISARQSGCPSQGTAIGTWSIFRNGVQHIECSKTSTRGVKGQNARQGGGVHPRFEGGQTPITLRLPKYGKTHRKVDLKIFDYVNLGKIDYFVKRGILDPTKLITIKVLSDCGLVKKVRYGVKLLSKGAERVNYPLNIEVSDASKSAIKHLRQLGGKVSLVYRNERCMRAHVRPHKELLPLRELIPPAWKVRKLLRLSEDRQIQIQFRKPKWLLEQEQQPLKPKSTFIYPVPIVVNSGKIRKRRPKLYRIINYNLP